MGLEALFGGNPQQQGLLAAIAQIAQASGPQRMPQSLYGILGGGMMAGQQATQQAQEQQLATQYRQQQIDGGQFELQERKRARQQQEMMEAAARGSVRSAGQQAAALPGGPTMVNAERIGEFQDGFDMDGFINRMMQINPMKALELRQSMKKAGPKFDSGITWVSGPDGKPMAVRTADDGSIKQVDGVAPRDKLELANLGGRDVAYNPFGLREGQTFQRTQTPDSIASTASAAASRAQADRHFGANFGLAKERLGIDRQEAAARASIGKAPTEFQGKSAAFGLRATEADKIINNLTGKYNPAAINSKTSVESWPLVGGMLGAATNKFSLTSTDQRAEQAQRDFINAVLRQESGAAIGADEFDNARKQYFPQPGDGPGVIAQKARNRQLAIQGFQSNAGRAAMTAPAAPSGTPGDITDLLNKYGGN